MYVYVIACVVAVAVAGVAGVAAAVAVYSSQRRDASSGESSQRRATISGEQRRFSLGVTSRDQSPPAAEEEQCVGVRVCACVFLQRR